MKNNIFVIVAISIIIGLILYFSPFNKNASTSLSGTLDINGIIPEEAYITIYAKESTEGQFKPIVEKLPAKDKIEWQWDKAKENILYDIKAILTIGKENKGTSIVKTISAPSSNIVLTINSQHLTPEPSFAEITGSIDLNGFVTKNSKITLYAKSAKDNDYQLALGEIEAEDGQSWSWNNATATETYSLKAVLYVDGNYAGESEHIRVTAPANNEFLRINSLYKPSPQKATISGNVIINGILQQDMTLKIFARNTSTSNTIEIIKNTKPQQETKWIWTDAIVGNEYAFYAEIRENTILAGKSDTLKTIAPAINEQLVINIRPNPNLAKPPNSPWIVCNSVNNNKWSVEFRFNTVSGAQQYWFQIGSQNGGNDINDTKLAAINQNVQSFPTDGINDKTTYFAQYAYSPCIDCKDSSSFSPFSNSLQFQCPATQPPTNTPVPPTPTITPTPTPTTAPTLTPTPTIPKNQARCDGICGSNGYECVFGLQCIPGEIPGSSRCRNPNCTDRQNCICN